VIMQLQMPVVDRAFQGGRLVRWHVGPGDPIRPGQTICTVAVERATLVRRAEDRGGLLRRRSKGMVNKQESNKGKVYLEVKLISSDRGQLHKGLVDEGDQVAAGDPLAVVTTTDHGSDAVADDAWRSAPLMRVTARFGDDTEVE